MARRNKTPEEQALDKLVEGLTSELKRLEPEALHRVSTILGEETNLQSLQGLIGGNNNTYVDSVRMQFSSPDDFFARWIHGLVSNAPSNRE